MVSRILIVLLVGLMPLSSRSQQPLSLNTSSSTILPGDLTPLNRLELIEARLRNHSMLSIEGLKAIESELSGLKLSGAECKKDCKERLVSIGEYANIRRLYLVSKEIVRLLEELDCDSPDSAYYTDYVLLYVGLSLEETVSDSAKAMLTHLWERYRNVDAPNLKAVLHNLSGLVAGKEGRSLEAIQHFEEAAMIFESLNLQEYLLTVRSNIGIEYHNIKIYTKSKDYLTSAYHVFQEMELTHRMAYMANNISVSYMHLGMQDSALYFGEQSLYYNRLEKNELGKAQVFANMCNIVRRQGDYAQSIAYADSSIQICKELGMDFGIGLNLINQAETYIAARRYAEAIAALQSAEDYLLDGASAEMNYAINANYAQAYYQSGAFTQAAHYFNKVIALKKDIDKQELQALMLSMDNSFDKMRADRKILSLNQKLRNTRFQNQLAWLSSALLLILLAAMAYWLYNRRRTHKLEVELALSKLKEMEMAFAMRQKETLYTDMKDRIIHGFTAQVLDEIKTTKLQLPSEHKASLDALLRKVELLSAGEELQSIDNKLSNVCEDYNQKLLNIYPDLTPNELKICNLIKLNLSSREIAKIINRSEKTINNLRSSIRRKMDLDLDTNLTVHLISLE